MTRKTDGTDEKALVPEAPTQKQQIQNLRDLLQRSKGQIEAALPRHLNADRLLRIAMTCISKTPRLAQCSPRSVVGAVMEAAQLGLEPDGLLGLAYLVPYRNRKTGQYECQLIPGYRGMIQLAYRSGMVASISARIVYENDVFEVEYGLAEKLRHVPTLKGDPGKPWAVYAVCVMRDGSHAMMPLSIADVDRVRRRSRASEDGPWQTDWEEMAKKTAIRRLAKWIPQTPELQRQAQKEELLDAGVEVESPFAEIFEEDDPPADTDKANVLRAAVSALVTSDEASCGRRVQSIEHS